MSREANKKTISANVSKLCRLCLLPCSLKYKLISSQKIRSIIEYCTSVKVEENSRYPTKICFPCLRNLWKFFSFKRKVAQNNKLLHNRYDKDILNIAVDEAEISTEKLDEPECKETTNEEPPPLIPLKPIVNEDILSNIIKTTQNITLQCTTCNEKFNNLDYLKDHKTTCHPSQNSLICNICKRQFKERKKLISHLKGHTVSKDYLCKICGKKYPNPSTFEVHMRSHTGERPFRCSICKKGFARWAGVVSHMLTHDDQRPFKCQTCHKSFKISSNLERHKVLHTGILPFCCNYCGKTFGQSDNLQLHIRSYHTNERPYLCSECGKSFVCSTRLNRHMWVHSDHKPFSCESCPKTYSNSTDLKNHHRARHGNGERPYACNMCDMRFFYQCRLTKHLKTHQRPFACTGCDKTFTTAALLDKHMKSKH